MSYEGSNEYITRNGKLIIRDAYEGDPEVDENDPIEWWHAVDYTNGSDKNDPGTYSAEIRVIGRHEVDREDALGNVWKVFEYQVAPDSLAWQKYKR